MSWSPPGQVTPIPPAPPPKHKPWWPWAIAGATLVGLAGIGLLGKALDEAPPRTTTANVVTVSEQTPTEECADRYPDLVTTVELVNTPENRQALVLDININGKGAAREHFQRGFLSNETATQEQADCAWLLVLSEMGL